MQLFITAFHREDEKIIIFEERVIYQLTKVLRAKKWDQIAVQWDQKRVVCEIFSLEKAKIETKALYEEEKTVEIWGKYLAIALPNKFEKIELIVQKCTEIGVEHLIFFPAKHSVLKEISASKMERLEKISLEAVEQSRWRKNLSTSFEKNIFSLCEWKNIFIAHQHGESVMWRVKNDDIKRGNKSSILMVWPEGWRHTDEEKMFENMSVEKISFGENILRTETAAIIWWRFVKNIL